MSLHSDTPLDRFEHANRTIPVTLAHPNMVLSRAGHTIGTSLINVGELMSSEVPGTEVTPDSGDGVRSKWIKVGMVISTAALAIGLVPTGIGVGIQAYQAKEQSKVVREDFDRKEKQQALQVAVHPLITFSDSRRVAVITNRSPAPIYQLRIYAALSKSVRDSKRGNMNYVTLGSLSPCTTVKVDVTVIADGAPTTREALRAGNPLDFGITFTDALGKGFHRHAAGQINPSSWLEFVDNGELDPRLPDAFTDYNRYADLRWGNVFGALSAGQKTEQHGVLGTPGKADLCVNDE
ncbi:hypothetical protein [Streptomyces cyaneofuscatus]|uniref:hypothetical protein n=1 Tax=Streptomyces cyaneofuscatus TaxID=66883 RepID=UPI0036D911F3